MRHSVAIRLIGCPNFLRNALRRCFLDEQIPDSFEGRKPWGAVFCFGCLACQFQSSSYSRLSGIKGARQWLSLLKLPPA